mmetsp:Transcript_15685/g.35921  ORF Transcript_15685/g.35921 Transcript_15685/m.35921 type:complete len:456 (-) Transcript_15685:172-1539(-)
MPSNDEISHDEAGNIVYSPSKDEPDISDVELHIYESQDEESVDSDLTSASQKVVAPTSGRLHSSFTSMYLRRTGNDEILQRAKAALALQRLARQEEMRRKVQTVERSRDHVTKWLNENYIVTYTQTPGLGDGVSIFEQLRSKAKEQVEELDVEQQSQDGDQSVDPDPSEVDVEGDVEDSFGSSTMHFIEGLQADVEELDDPGPNVGEVAPKAVAAGKTIATSASNTIPEISASFSPVSCHEVFSHSITVPQLFPLQPQKMCEEDFDSDEEELTKKAGCCFFRNPIKMYHHNRSPRISSMLEKLSTHAISEDSALSVADTPGGKDCQGRDSPYSERSTEEGKDLSASEGAASNERILPEEHWEESDRDNNLRSESWISRDSQQKEYARQAEQLSQYSTGPIADSRSRLRVPPRPVSRPANPLLIVDMVAHPGGGGQNSAVSATKMHPAKSIGWASM